MVLEISQNYMFYSFAKEIWDDLNNKFSLKKDFAACYDNESNRVFNTPNKSLSLFISLYIRILGCG